MLTGHTEEKQNKEMMGECEGMTIHYFNGKGEQVFISGVIHLQNTDNTVWIALLENDKELTLLTERIEGIYSEDTKTRNLGEYKSH